MFKGLHYKDSKSEPCVHSYLMKKYLMPGHPYALTLSSGAPDALGLLGLSMKEKFQRLRLETKSLEVVPEFCYLGDMLSAGGGCELAAITRCKCAWGKFRQLLPLLTNRHLPLLTRDKVYSSCARSVMLHAAET